MILPDELALGAASGRPSRAISAAPNPSGMRSAIVSSPAVTSGWMPEPFARGSTSVSGPGQKASASFRDSAVEDRDLLGHGQAGDMRDQRVETRPALGLENPGHGGAVGRVAGKAIDRLGRDGDDFAGFEQRQRRGHRVADFQDFRHRRIPVHVVRLL